MIELNEAETAEEALEQYYRMAPGDVLIFDEAQAIDDAMKRRFTSKMRTWSPRLMEKRINQLSLDLARRE